MAFQTNHHRNPSGEVDLAGYATADSPGLTVTSALVRSTAWAAAGAYSAYRKVTNPDATARAARIQTAPSGLGAIPCNALDTVSVRMSTNQVQAHPSGANIHTFADDAAGATITSRMSALVTGAGVLVLTDSWDMPAGTAFVAHSLYHGSALAGPWTLEEYLDAIQVAINEALPPQYFDGDTWRGEWTGTPHASTSLLWSARAEIQEVVFQANEGSDLVYLDRGATVDVLEPGSRDPALRVPATERLPVYESETGAVTQAQPLATLLGRIEGFVDSVDAPDGFDLLVTPASGAAYVQPIRNILRTVVESGPRGNQGIQGNTGGSGPPGADGKTILNGVGPPAPALGTDGDFYVDTTAPPSMYGPKTAGAWGDPIDLFGQQGEPGVDGRTIHNGSGIPASGLGADGDFYIDTATWDLYGPKTAGAWGTATSLIGPQGIQGEPGPGGEDTVHRGSLDVHGVPHSAVTNGQGLVRTDGGWEPASLSLADLSNLTALSPAGKAILDDHLALRDLSNLQALSAAGKAVLDDDFALKAAFDSHAADVAIHGSGREVDFAEITTSPPTSATTYPGPLITGLSIVVPAGARPVLLELWTGVGYNTLAGGGCVIGIFDGATEVAQAQMRSASANYGVPLYARRRLPVPVASTTYTVKLGAYGSAGGNAGVIASGTSPMQLQATEC